MNDKLALCIVYLGFLLLSYIVYKFSLRLTKIWATIFFILYVWSIYFYFELFNQLHHYLRDRGIYIALGHADISLLMLMAFCYLNALVLFIIVVLKLAGKSDK
jgi:hypothetical protein